MKKKILYTLLILFAAFIAYAVYTINNPASPLGTASFSENDKDITVTYSRPYKKGRLIFGSEDESALVPFDNYWRTGANRHTMIKTNSDLIFGDNVLSKGEYSLYTKPGLNTWDITFNSTNAYFGISQPDSEMDLFSITVPSNTIDESIEQLTFDFVSDSLSSGIRLRWDLTEVVIPFN
ncbi:MAG: DUF2911 domain-containing protein [Flavobacteriaceae bacterium]|jgi:hypothetical protein|nr:DUF2911 domain-containing protein [Flavobacteriaceae bacterium]MBT4415117.1 DUF2911 domain-containing protein [Flavobacteriaceae bacterium]MBT5012718.1 DUF2911 domain-containing protein [Flavobacteriaceae bacterium]MBT5395673.1 DUF2911 domain-containing protein [Flavobacteriaceae bacterium]MBT5857472.1 DUF2911 domain-containing protein [Flavobacteriaceae bacterium]|tara:strand:+ start:187 stop:723 length:537 start_codon:yes stop_codon:yes gene_type:complete